MDDKCNHGKLYTEDCHRCEIAWQESSVAWLIVALEKSRSALAKARQALKNESAAPAASGEE